MCLSADQGLNPQSATQSGFEPTILHANHYNTDVVVDVRDTEDLLAKNKINIRNWLNIYSFFTKRNNFIYGTQSVIFYLMSNKI
jgi:hypothetical protein